MVNNGGVPMLCKHLVALRNICSKAALVLLDKLMVADPALTGPVVAQGGLVACIKTLESNDARSIHCLTAFCIARMITHCESHRAMAVELGAVPLVVRILDRSEELGRMCALAAILRLAQGPVALLQPLVEAGALLAVVKVVRSEPDDSIAKRAALVLLCLCQFGTSITKTALVSAVMPRMAYLLRDKEIPGDMVCVGDSPSEPASSQEPEIAGPRAQDGTTDQTHDRATANERLLQMMVGLTSGSKGACIALA